MSTTLDVNYALDERYVPHQLAGTVDIDEFIVGDEAFAVQAPASYEVTLTALDEGILAQGEVSLPVRGKCVRCLEDFDIVISSEVDSMFFYEPTQDDDGDPYPEVDEFGHIPLEAELIEDLIVASPFAPIHDETCKGLCPDCGTNLNTDPCHCNEKPDDDHPFAVLDALLAEDGD
ncbi:MAG: YceD family protein [Coriobacteriia bacterium]|nr:YceD family protein [Coriobacteriia bacterium]